MATYGAGFTLTVIFSCILKNRLAESVSKVNELVWPQNNNFHDEMVEQYGRVKRFLPAVLRDLHFQAAPAGEHTLAAIHYLTELNGSKKRILDDAPEHIITGPWKRLVYDAEGRILALSAGTPSGCIATPGHLARKQRPLGKSPREAVAGGRMAGSESPWIATRGCSTWPFTLTSISKIDVSVV
jgi:hypothetical protein